MNERIIGLVNALLLAYPPDMWREDDEGIKLVNSLGNPAETCRVRRECYSVTQLERMTDALPMQEGFLSALCRANAGTPLWKASVRNFLLGWVAQ